MPAESKKSAETIAGQSAAPAKSKPAPSSGKAAQAKVTLLDGSVLDVAIDVRPIVLFMVIAFVNYCYFASRSERPKVKIWSIQYAPD